MYVTSCEFGYSDADTDADTKIREMLRVYDMSLKYTMSNNIVCIGI